MMPVHYRAIPAVNLLGEFNNQRGENRETRVESGSLLGKAGELTQKIRRKKEKTGTNTTADERG
jgi:hypothetical protein